MISDVGLELFGEDDSPLIPASQQHEKWIVITTIHEPGETAKALAGIAGWWMVVVGDVNTKVPWEYVIIYNFVAYNIILNCGNFHMSGKACVKRFRIL